MPIRQITLTGQLPHSMPEDSGPADWTGSLALSGDVAFLTAVQAIGPDALYFAVTFDRAGSRIVVTPGARVDYEGLSTQSKLPQISLSLEFRFSDGPVQDTIDAAKVTVLDRDDTPPSALAFASGGTVQIGVPGATIGTLAVTDPDSIGPFAFLLPDSESTRYEIVGGTLKLRAGVALDATALPGTTVFVTVSDGHQSAAFALDVATTTAPVAQPAPAVVLPIDPPAGGFGQVTPDLVQGLLESTKATGATPQGDGSYVVSLVGGGSVTVAAGDALRFTDGVMDWRPDGPAAGAAAIGLGVLGHAPTGMALGALVTQFEHGVSWTAIAKAMLATLPLPVPGNDGYVAQLFNNLLGRDPTDAELVQQSGRLSSGLSRAQLAVDIALGPEATAHLASEEGWWAPQALGAAHAWHADTGGVSLAVAAAATPAITQVWML